MFIQACFMENNQALDWFTKQGFLKRCSGAVPPEAHKEFRVITWGDNVGLPYIRGQKVSQYQNRDTE